MRRQGFLFWIPGSRAVGPRLGMTT